MRPAHGRLARSFFTSCFFLFLAFELWAVEARPVPGLPETVVVGQVFDRQGRPLGGVSISTEGSNLVAAQSNEEGYFLIRFHSEKRIRLLFSSLGYHKHRVWVEPGQGLGIEVRLQESINWLPEVFVLPGSNPGLELIKKARKYRKRNDLTQQAGYEAKGSEETFVFLRKLWKPDSPYRRHLWKPDFAEDSSALMPLYRSQKSFLLSPAGRSEISDSTLRADESPEGFFEGLSQSLGALSMNFYENSVFLLGRGFVSPLGQVGTSYYKYFLADSIASANAKRYRIDFRNATGQDAAFDGTLWLDSASLALVALEARLPRNSAANFVDGFHIQQRFGRLSNGSWSKQSEKLSLSLTYELFPDSLPGKTALILHKNTRLDTRISEPPVADEILEAPDYECDSIDIRLEALRKDPLFRSALWIADAAFTGQARIGKVDVGPVQHILRVTDVEGWRFNLPLRSNEKLWRNFSIGGNLGYAAAKKVFLYSAFAFFRPKAWRSQRFGGGYTHDFRRIDYSYSDFLFRENPLQSGDEDFSSSVMSLLSSAKLNERKEFWLSCRSDWTPSLESNIYLRHTQQLPALWLPMHSPRGGVAALNSSSLLLSFRYAPRQRYYDDHLQRIYIPGGEPVFYFNAEWGQYQFGGQKGLYAKLSAMLLKRFSFGFGHTDLLLRADGALGALPYPLLIFPHGNETPGYHLQRFSMMNYMEYGADRNLQLHNEWTFNRLLLGRLPFISRLRLRELLSLKVNYGGLHSRHRDLMDFPEYLKAADRPYAEFGIGIANILRIFSFQSIWACNDLLGPAPLRWSPRLYMAIEF